VRRRVFLALIASVTTWPRSLLAQQRERMRRVGILTGGPNDTIFRSDLAVFQKALHHLGWVEGRNIEFNIRSGDNDALRVATEAKELIRFNPDVMLVGPSNALLPLRSQTSTIPIVFVRVSDPVGQGIVSSLARPSGNITGFSNMEFSLVGKWLQTLKEISPRIRRAAMMIHTSNSVSSYWFKTFESVAPKFAIEPIAAPIAGRTDIQTIFETIARAKDGAIIVPGDTFTESSENRELIIKSAATHEVPAIYARQDFVPHGGLICYGIDQREQYRLAAAYVDRILNGELAGDLPIQQPSKYFLTINLKSAKALGLSIPLILQQLADEVIE
jgi:putative tryptophan/tyrosine transport system substrate-binding protein